MSQVINYFFFNKRIFKGIRIVDKLSLVFKSILIFFKIGSSSSTRSRADIVNSLRIDSSTDESTCKGNSMRCSSINSDILRFFLSLKQFNIFRFQWKMLIKIRIINRIKSLNKFLLLIIWRIMKSPRNKSHIL